MSAKCIYKEVDGKEDVMCRGIDLSGREEGHEKLANSENLW